MIKNKVIILILSIFLISSCSDKEDPLGKWDDNIKLSTKNVQFGVNADSVVITTEGDWWWINGISVNGIRSVYYNREDVDLEADSYVLEGDCYIVEKRDKNTLFISMSENLTGNERRMLVTLEAGDYFDYVEILQALN
jgi:hypothetical protein